MRHCKKWLGALLPLMLGLAACDDFAPAGGDGNGQLRWVLDHGVLTKANTEEMPDTNDFILTVRNAAGNILYEGTYGASPQVLDVEEGYYTVSIVSVKFDTPAFSKPQYGDEQVVRVPGGQSVTVKLCCSLQNAGIRLRTGSDFLTAYPDGILFVKQGDVKLKYLYRETRVAYVKPGSVSVILNESGKEQTLFTRNLAAREILSVSISAPGDGSGSGQVKVAVDTSKTWSNEQYVIGGDNDSGSGNDGGQWKNAIAVGEAAQHAGETGVWLYGYIVGGDLSSAGKSVKTDGITKNTHIALADRSTITTKEDCVAVELPNGSTRAALNLVDHPENLGRAVLLQGDIVAAYYGLPGLQGLSAFQWQD